jgi:16S rRNA (adenine1518-N6/adenine1519-N6)-dimethyltransferase
LSSNRSSHRPQKKWGQNFLRNSGAVQKIVEALRPEPGELILEIGPGEGALTRELVKLGARVHAIEIDPSLAARLRTQFSENDFTLTEGDATSAPLPEVPFVAVGNLPYNVGNPIIRRVIAAPQFRRGVFMVQKEVADRITAAPRDEAYGFFPIAIALYARTSVLLTLGPGSFFPPPKVKSSVVIFDRYEPHLKSDRESILKIASGAFRLRRKKLVNSLMSIGLARESILRAMQEASIEENARAEQLALEDFDRLAFAIRQQGDVVPTFSESEELP